MNKFKTFSVDTKSLNPASNSSSCGCATEGCCDTQETSSCDCNEPKAQEPSLLPLPNSIVIDGKTVDVSPEDNNIVDVAKRAKISIPAPCYLNGRKKGCCKACVVEIEGEQKYACATRPTEGMEIVLDRPDLKELRKERVKEYGQMIKGK